MCLRFNVFSISFTMPRRPSPAIDSTSMIRKLRAKDREIVRLQRQIHYLTTRSNISPAAQMFTDITKPANIQKTCPVKVVAPVSVLQTIEPVQQSELPHDKCSEVSTNDALSSVSSYKQNLPILQLSCFEVSERHSDAIWDKWNMGTDECECECELEDESLQLSSLSYPLISPHKSQDCDSEILEIYDKKHHRFVIVLD